MSLARVVAEYIAHGAYAAELITDDRLQTTSPPNFTERCGICYHADMRSRVRTVRSGRTGGDAMSSNPEQDRSPEFGAGRQSVADIPTTPQPEQQPLFSVDTNGKLT